MTKTVFDTLLTIASEEFGVSTRQILAKTRSPDHISARFALAWIMRDVFKLHPEDIGHWMGGRTRTAILAALGQVSDWRETDLGFRRKTDRIFMAARNLNRKAAA
jgi:chromosomal replication initiation ATPase DnaA